LQRVNKFFYTFIFILSINLDAEVSDEFINLFVNVLPCTDEFLEYIDDDRSLREDFFFETDEEFNILKDIFKNYCSGSSPDTINTISQRIFNETVANKNLLYAIHSSKFAYHLFDAEPLKISNVMFNELTLLNKINKDDLGSSKDISNIIHNVAYGIETFELSEFNEIYDENALNFSSVANLMYSLIERFVLSVIDETFELEDLSEIAETLFSVRIAQSTNLNFYGSPLERFGARETIIKIYLNNYEDGVIKYKEFNSLIGDMNLEIKSDDFIVIYPTIDQIINLNTISTSFQNNKTIDGVGYVNESDKIFSETMIKILFDNFDDHTEELIPELTNRNLNNQKNINCELQDKKYNPDKNSLDSLSLELQFLSYKLSCKDSSGILFDLIDKLTNFYTKVSKESFSEEDLEDILLEASLISMFIDMFITQDSDIVFSDGELDFFIQKYILLKETQLEAGYIKTITSFEDLYSILTFTQSFDLVYEFILDDQSKYESVFNSLRSDFYDLIIFDIDALKASLLSETVDKSSKIFISQGISLVGLSFLSSVSNFDPEYIQVLVEDFKSGIDENKYKKILELLELTSFYLDNIDNIFQSTSPEFIFTIKPLDDWFVFKDLLALELTLKYALVSSDLISFEEYFLFSQKRIDQIISLRPEKISLEKFKSDFIKENADLSFIDAVIEYDNLQKEYRELLESKVILNQNIYDYAPSEIFSLEFTYKSKLLAIQDKLFDEESVGILFAHDVLNSKMIRSKLGPNEGLLSFLSGNFFTIGVLLTNNTNFLIPLPISQGGFREKSEKIINSFTDPKSEIPKYELSLMYNSLFGAFDLSDIENLYIVTDEVFAGFPFHALVNDQNQKWSIDEYTISYLSSEKLLPYLDKRRISKNNRFLGFGNPTLNKDTLESQIDDFFDERGDYPVNNISDLYELPDTETEIRNIAKYFRKSEIFFQDDATEENLLVNLDKSIDILAFATHSVKGMSKFYNDRGLILTPENSDNYANDGFLSNQQIKFLNLDNNPIVLLTACNTIDPQYYLSLPYSGLASSFMEAGADGVLLSLWNVNSKSSSELNQGIFTNNNSYFAGALRNSIINIKSQEQYSHPYFWAPYIYLGR